jgi:hypothetical protein
VQLPPKGAQSIPAASYKIQTRSERTPMPDNLSEEIETGRVLLQQLDEVGIPHPQSPTKVVSRLFRQAGVYPLPNLVVDQCDHKFAEATEQAIKEGKSVKLAKYIGRIAYCAAMPKLSGATNIRDFIACVTYAMALDIVPGNEGTRLLYAAQVAHMALTKRPKKRNKSSHTSTAASVPTSKESTL